ncbi:hypothetical protein E0Z10_g7850 [Xylaria hypoxylon]|uniref:PARP catalytic domain-containing protein n=1 Tax=Xylaria hypoxylon TaxID=37992 RepID=A0A4Z0Y9P5_9PEZI|nr:hypothetical protein E0Z10_g7850 [Xylaria hypoxylon]
MVVQMYRITPDNPKYLTYENQFKQGWTHKGKSAKITRIYLAKNDDIDRAYRGKRFNNYRGNKRYKIYFHGTQRACNIGRWGNSLRYCKKPECGLCGILWHSFDTKLCRSARMFGAGIYTTPSSSSACTVPG